MNKLVVLVCGVLIATGALATDSSEKLKKFKGNTVSAISVDQAMDKSTAMFDEIDQDANGSFTIDEFELFSEGKKITKQFKKMDVDNDGVVTKIEYTAFKDQQRAKQNTQKSQ